MKKEIYLFMFVMVSVVLVSSFAFAGFFDDIYGKITGKVSDTTTLNITIGNSDPTITWVESIPAQTPNEGGVNYTTFNFTATDNDGAGTINVSSAQAFFQKSGESTRSNTSCVNWSSSGNNVNFTCTIGIWYYDAAASDWIINTTIRDNNDAYGENSSEAFQIIPLISMAMSPIALAWSDFGVAQTNQESTIPITINNTGNDVNLNINVTAYDLQGETVDTSQYIYAANFSVQNITSTCAGTTMSNVTSLNVTSTILQSGNNSLNYNNATSGQEQLFFCITAVNSDLSSQSYSSAAYGPWNIEIIT